MDHIPHIPGASLPESFSHVPSISFATCNAGDSHSLFCVGQIDPPGDDAPTGEPWVPLLHAPEPPPAEPPPGSPTSDPTLELPAGSLIDHILCSNDCPSSPTCSFEFPSNATPFTCTTAQDTVLRPLALQLAELPDFPSVMDSVTRVIGSPHLFGLRTDCSLCAQVKRTSATLIDGGTNICLTSNLNLLLVEVVEIPPLPISVAINGEEPHIDDSCTGRGYLPLNLSDGSTHWQLSFYCKNAVEMIISPQAILASSDLFALWTQTRFKDGCPG